jgi:predicted 3-demethylubiquinone-9 3-methyltransferase (glyoxalase superfamily)
MQKILTSLWFTNCAQEAVDLYVSIFDNSRIQRIARYGEAGPEQAGKIMTIEFQLEGQDFLAINSDVKFPFSPAVSLVVNCQGQEEIDRLWNQLAADPEGGQCGWIEDKFGLSWQIVTPELSDMICDPDPVKSQAVMRAMLPMKRLDLAELKHAYTAA